MSTTQFPQAFASAEEAWFWTVTCLQIRHGARMQNAQRGPDSIRRPCGPGDVIRALDMLYRRGSIGPDHARVLRRYGEQAVAPSASGQAADAKLWNEAMAQLDAMLRPKGIVA